MPKKTRSQKIIASLRKQLQTQETVRQAVTRETLVEKATPTIAEPELERPAAFSSFILSDLKKSLFLTLLAISLEFVLYYLLELGGFERLGWIIDLIGKRAGEKP